MLDNSSGFFTSRFNSDEVKEVFDGEHRLWIEILNRSFEDNIVIKKKRPLGFLVVEPENLTFIYVPIKKRSKTKEKAYCSYKRKRQLGGGGGFLNRHDFTYAGRNTVNQVEKIAAKPTFNLSRQGNKKQHI